MSDPFTALTSALADRYTIERELGRGGAAAVFLAEDLRHHRKVALKILRPKVAEAVGRDRFLKEIEVAAGLIHPHIVPLFDSGDASGVLYFVMPFVEGESLRARLDREGALPVDEAVRIARELADALGYAHAHGVVHRDVKPENVLLEAGHAVLADFGVARAVSEAGSERLTRTGVAVGTPAYMSPEQAAADREVDGRADQYALGCLLYEMLTGQPPFTGPSSDSVIRQQLVATPRPVTQLRSSVPESVTAVIEKAMAKAPPDRFGCMEAFAGALEGAKQVTAPSHGRATLLGGGWRWGAVIGLAGAAAVVAAVTLRPEPAVTGGDLPTVLVMPADVSDAASQELADGITDATYRRLTLVTGLTVKKPYRRDQFDDTDM
ncbi:MAG: serine/threonine protein kinase, partial [Gemmatimonadetes bacterium]|nr:serine/threonine protein kinase [Gemmatimonadota bacterium]